VCFGVVVVVVGFGSDDCFGETKKNKNKREEKEKRKSKDQSNSCRVKLIKVL